MSKNVNVLQRLLAFCVKFERERNADEYRTCAVVLKFMPVIIVTVGAAHMSGDSQVISESSS